MLTLLGFNISCRSQKFRSTLPSSKDSFKWSLILKLLKKCYHYSILALVFFGSFLTAYLTFIRKQLMVKILLPAMSFLFASISHGAVRKMSVSFLISPCAINSLCLKDLRATKISRTFDHFSDLWGVKVNMGRIAKYHPIFKILVSIDSC